MTGTSPGFGVTRTVTASNFPKLWASTGYLLLYRTAAATTSACDWRIADLVDAKPHLALSGDSTIGHFAHQTACAPGSQSTRSPAHRKARGRSRQAPQASAFDDAGRVSVTGQVGFLCNRAGVHGGLPHPRLSNRIVPAWGQFADPQPPQSGRSYGCPGSVASFDAAVGRGKLHSPPPDRLKEHCATELLLQCRRKFFRPRA